MARGDGRHNRWSTCERKTRFPDYHEATRRAAQIGLRAYECMLCGGWHLTHQASRPSKRPHAPPPAPKPVISDITKLGMQLLEAHRILDKLIERQRAGVELPEAMITQARERVEHARKALEEARAQKETP